MLFRCPCGAVERVALGTAGGHVLRNMVESPCGAKVALVVRSEFVPCGFIVWSFR